MASSSSSSSSSIAAREISYDVFLSFRGADTRHSFASHLYAALTRKNLNTFMDEHDLERGEYISPNILKAIRESKYLVVIFSEDYASSRWCLDELVLIMKCKNSMDRKVFPIFYRVDPSHVSDLEGNFGEGFKKLKEQFTEDLKRVKEWRAALVEASELSGEVSSEYKHEPVLIEKVAECIMKQLYSKSFEESNPLFGMDLHIQQILPCLEKGSSVRSLGLWGMGGIGKTTIAEVVYSRISHQFDHCCYLHNVREESEKIGLVALRKKFFSTLLGIETPDVGMLSVLPAFIKDALSRLKVLVVLDDIFDSSQLEALGVSKDLFGPGSRIIITSRDKQALNIANKIYEVKGLNDSDALQLLSMKAFEQMHPPEGYEELSEKVVKYAGGIPLALTVLGSHLLKSSMDQWVLLLNKLKQSPEPSSILKISYDSLEEDMLREIFLDIAILFKGCTVNSVRHILDEWQIYRLQDKCLITIRNDTIGMHDLLQEMGRHIVRSRGNWLWDQGNICNLLTANMKNKSVEGILLDISEAENIPLSSTALAMFHYMPNLRVLKFYHKLFQQKKQDPVFKLESSQSGCSLKLPPKLRLLHWEDYPFEYVPSNSFMPNLVELTLLNSNVVLWDGKCPQNLKRLDLSQSVRLKRLPDLSLATQLEKIFLEKCESLVEIPPSIQSLEYLTDLFLQNCSNLESIPSLSKLKSLRRLILNYCSNLRILPETPRGIELIGLKSSGIEKWSSIPYWEKVTSLSMENCKNLVEIPSLVHLKSLGILNLAGCSNLKMLPEIPNCIKRLELQKSGLERWSPDIGNLENLRFLDMRFCRNLESFPSLIHSEYLHTLYLQGCKSLSILPEIPSTIKSLKLEDSGLQEVRGFCYPNTKTAKLPSSTRRVTSSLHELSFRNLKHLDHIPDSICELKCLQSLDLSGCSKLAKLPPLNGLITLKRLILDGSGPEEIPYDLPSGLVQLSMENCKNLETLPESICELTCLQTLVLNGCSNLVNWQPWNGLKSVSRLTVNGCESTQPPSSLVELSMSNLPSLENFPALNLVGLRHLEITNCLKLVKLPPLDGLVSLLSLHLDNCGITEFPTKLPLSLHHLSAYGCSDLSVIPDNIWELKCVEFLYLRDCTSLRYIPPLDGLVSLLSLHLDNCGITEFPTKLPLSLHHLSAYGCSDLSVIPDSIWELKCLETLYLSDCTSLRYIPPLDGLVSLLSLHLDNCGITEFPTKLPLSLHRLSAYGCSDLSVIPDSIWELKCLATLYLRDCTSLRYIPPLDGLVSLLSLHLNNCGITEFPTKLPLSLHHLSADGCSNLSVIPDNICELKCLETLDLSDCSSLRYIPPLDGLESLIRIDLRRSAVVEIPAELPSSLENVMLPISEN